MVLRGQKNDLDSVRNVVCLCTSRPKKNLKGTCAPPQIKGLTFKEISGLQAWKAQIEYYNQQSSAWHVKKELQTALYDEEWKTCIGELEGTLPLFSSLRQFRCESGAPLLSLDLVASVSSLQCLVLRKVHIEDDDLIKLCTYSPAPQKLTNHRRWVAEFGPS